MCTEQTFLNRFGAPGIRFIWGRLNKLVCNNNLILVECDFLLTDDVGVFAAGTLCCVALIFACLLNFENKQKQIKTMVKLTINNY